MLSTKNLKPGERITKKLNCLSFDVGIRNLCYCLIEYSDEPDQEFTIRLWELIDLKAETTADAVIALHRELDKRNWMPNADHIVIEAQSHSNPAMKVISHVIQSYFICRSTPRDIEKRDLGAGGTVTIERGKKLSIHFISPKNKFKVANVPDPEGPSGHSKHKRIAILIAKKVLKACPDRSMLEYLSMHRKKDDLADSFLQGLYFLRLTKQKSSASKRILDHLRAEVTIKDKNDAAVVTGAPVYSSLPDFDGKSVFPSQKFERH